MLPSISMFPEVLATPPIFIIYTVWKVSKYGVLSDPYFPLIRTKSQYSVRIRLIRTKKNPFLDTFYAVLTLALANSFSINSLLTYCRIGGISCRKVETNSLLHAPSYHPESNLCHLQAHVQLFSCMNEESSIQRLCPCRDYEKDQIAICQNCL